MKKYIAVIPARAGSKGVKDKNITPINGIPLLAYSVLSALESKYVDRVIVWTDSQEYMQIGLNYGAESFGLRSPENAQDFSTDTEMFLEFYKLVASKKIKVDAFVHLRPTYPIRQSNLIDKCIEQFDSNFDCYDSLRTMTKATENIFKMWIQHSGLNEANLDIVAAANYLPFGNEAHSAPRQILPNVYHQNACVDIIKIDTLLYQKSCAGKKVFPFIMDDENLDIDSINDINKVNLRLKNGL